MQRYEHFLSRKLTRAAYKAKILQNVNCIFKIRNRGIFISRKKRLDPNSGGVLIKNLFLQKLLQISFIQKEEEEEEKI